jgi:fused signal recognition particle receptor
MQELEKIRRVLGKRIPGAPHETLLVLDGTTGQNAVRQARMFHEAAPVTGIFLTKLDGTARGGAVLSIRDELDIPVKFIGTGETPDDIQPFDAKAFVDALFA